MDWKLLFSTFGLVFLAEMGDKTQLAAISLVSRYKSPWAVFLGASIAMAVVTAIGVIFGDVLTRYVSVEYLRKGGALLFIIVGLLMFFEIF